MYLQARVFIKIALLHLLAAGFLGGGLLVTTTLGNPGLAPLRPLLYHLIAVGWITQLIAGVALWMFPPLSRERPRGNETFGWVAYGALNSGLLLRAIAEPLLTWNPQPWQAIALVLSGVLQAVAIWLIVLMLSPRVKGRGGVRRAWGREAGVGA
jgi:hypothetical protein